MPRENTFTDSGIGVISSFSGTFESDNFLQTLQSRFESDTVVRNLRYVVTDHTAVENFNISTDDVNKAVKSSTAASELKPNICIASVTPNNLAFGPLECGGIMVICSHGSLKTFTALQKQNSGFVLK